MSTYTEKLWGSTTATYPTSVLTKRWTTTNETAVQCISDTTGEGDYVFEQEWSAIARRLNSLDAIDGDANRDDIELLARFKLEGTARQEYEFGLVGRGSGSGGSETGYECYLRESGTNDLFLRIVEMSSGSATVLEDTGVLLYEVEDEWLWMRFRINGSDIKAKLWRDGTVEPGWQSENTDSTITAAGWGGLWGYQDDLRTKVDYLSIGTNGDTAPITADTSVPVRLTTVNAMVMASEGDPRVRLTTVNAMVMASEGDPRVRLTTVNKMVMYSRATTGLDSGGALTIIT